MKKLVLTSLAVVASAVLVHAQGLVSLAATVKGVVDTNGASIGEGTGAATGLDAYYFELLDMTASQWAGLSGSQQTGADNLLANPSDLSLWSDSGISGNTSGLGTQAGEITALGGSAGTTAANWGAPTGSSYSTGPTDYYMIVGWSAGLGANWAAVAGAITNSSVGSSGWFGETAIYYNEAGGGPDTLPVVSVWGSSASTTTLAGAGTPSGEVAGILQLMPVPEPATLALAGFGGISMLFLRRRKVWSSRKNRTS
jgi:hypothetical protein